MNTLRLRRSRHPLTIRRLQPLAAAVALAAFTTIALPVAAQTAAPAAAVVDFAVPAGTLDDALGQFGRQTGLLVSVDAALTRGLRSAGLTGRYTVEEGLRRLLAGTGLEPVAQGDGRYTLRSANGPVTLKKLEVSANQLGVITEDTGFYTPGTIATATRLVLTPRETPQSISVVTRQEMNDFNLTSIDKVMEHTPGVNIVTQDSERTVYYVRGFAINTFQYDGVPMERNSGYSAGHTLSDMAIYDRVEVLKGATGLLTGSGDPGATINLIRKKPTHDFQGEILVGAGSWDNYRGQLDVGGALGENVRARFVAAHQDKRSHQDGHERKSTVYYGIVEADLTEATLLTIGADYQDNDPKRSSWGGIPIYDSLGRFNRMPRSFNNGATWSYWEQYTRSGFATLEHRFGNEWVAKLQLNHQINGYEAEMAGVAQGNPNPATGAGTWLFGPTRYEGETKSDALDAYASGPFALLGRSHELVVGVSAAKRRWKNQQNLRPLGYNQNVPDFYRWSGFAVYPNPWRAPTFIDETTRENGLYATARFNLRDDLKLITGARVMNFEREELEENGLVVPYLGVVYDLDETHSLYASYTTIFKPQPLRDEQGRSLDPLEGENYEVGTKSEFFDGLLNVSVALFQLDQDNYGVTTGGVTPTGATAYRAIDGVRTRGYELELSGELTPSWDVHAGFSHKVSRRDGDKIETLTPENQFTLFTTYQLPGAWERLTLGGGLRWQDKTWVDANNPVLGTVKHTADSYWLVDAMMSYRVTDQLLARLNINNLLDEKYYTIFDAYDTYTWGEPRSATVSLSYRF